MILRTRLRIAMVGMVGLTAVSVAWLAHNAFLSIVLPNALGKLEADTRSLAADLRGFVHEAEADVLALRRYPAVVELAGGPTGGEARQRIASVFAAELNAKPQYVQLRLIGRDGFEMVRVDRSGEDGAVRVVPNGELQPKADRPYVAQALARTVNPPFVSPIELNQEFGVIEQPYLPVLRVAAPVETPGGEVFGIVVANLNMRPAFAQLRAAGTRGRSVYLVSGDGEALVHPDTALEFTRARGIAADGQVLNVVRPPVPDSAVTQVVNSTDGRLGATALSLRPADGPMVTLVLTEPEAQLVAGASSLVRSAVVGGAAVAAVAMLLATAIVGSLTRPVGDMVTSVRAYEDSGTWSPPASVQGELRVLSDALGAMARSKHEKTLALEREVLTRRATEARFQVAVEASPNGLLMVDGSGTIVLVNSEIEHLFGYARDEMLGQPVEMLVPVSVRARHPDLRSAFGEEPERRPMGAGRDLFGRRKDGSEMSVEIGLNPIEMPDGVYVLASVVDISERKEAQDELRRSNAELEQFAYVASHDLQEPLRMVASYTQLLERRYKGQLDDRADKYIYYAVDGAKRMQLLINDLLRFSRVKTHARPFVQTDSAAVAEQIVRSVLRTVIQEAGGTVHVDELPIVMADPVQLGQVFQNLISNAIKFRAEGRAPVVSVSAERVDSEWRFAVADNGIGIEAEYSDRIFQMFQRLHGVGAYPGSGVGLALVRKIVERHRGRVWFESAPGSGATFYFTLPSAIA